LNGKGVADRPENQAALGAKAKLANTWRIAATVGAPSAARRGI
jgi:hypothetical protein